MSSIPAERRKKKTVAKTAQPMTAKVSLVKSSAQQRLRTQVLVFEWQEKLFSHRQVSEATLRQAAGWLQSQTYDEVIEERVVQDFCGYPLCDQTPQKQQPRYRISLSQRKVFDQSELASYCSEACFQKSRYYSLQLAQDPVWMRDASKVPKIHIVPLDQDFKCAVAKEKERSQRRRSLREIQHDYVKHMLGNVPAHDGVKGIEIIETVSKAPQAPIPSAGVHDAIEGYRITMRKGEEASTEPSTMVLTNDALAQATALNENTPLDDEEAILENAMETMMLLKSMKLDDPNEQRAAAASSQPKPPSKSSSKPLSTSSSKPSPNPSKPMSNSSQAPSSPSQQASSPSQPGSNPSPPSKEPLPSSGRRSSSSTATSSHAANTVSSHPPRKPSAGDASLSPVTTTLSSDPSNINVINVVTKDAKKPPTTKKKKKREPEMSLFGKTWTVVDRMTTKSTRQYLTELDQGKTPQVADILHDESLDETVLLRCQIFSERILETYNLIRSQIGVDIALEKDIVDLIKTFRFADASVVVMEPAQTYMITLVLFKALADITLQEMSWQHGFEDCCQSIGQTTDVVNACVRVLKVAST
ncbi:Rtr1/RPAP2 family-domain-containing protein [Radiomyces spectabilis]|uniref:Rtr1/RPAP2 family-domain-containing protein n=1 Tax=Radiomyces spectabilis TaxID=64574 RepID=UPI00221E8FF5|nr:Rtr1/RPAP2 family-domain-containing protein [Radiomyces spectabilis]KAI8372977.1 Rtr1/RPAP2 family-domain-containing protein [Radiomyces spectabilis]